MSSFFDCADRLGILIQQDGIISDAQYTDEPEFLKLFGEEAADQARRLASHPSLFMWSGSNEIDLSQAQLDTWFGNITKIDASRPVWPSCPAVPWVSGVDAGGLPNGSAFTLGTLPAGFSKNTKAPSESHQYWFRYCGEPVATGDKCPKPPCGCEIHGRSCWDDAFYVETSFASEYGAQRKKPNPQFRSRLSRARLGKLSPIIQTQLNRHTALFLRRVGWNAICRVPRSGARVGGD